MEFVFRPSVEIDEFEVAVLGMNLTLRMLVL